VGTAEISLQTTVTVLDLYTAEPNETPVPVWNRELKLQEEREG